MKYFWFAAYIACIVCVFAWVGFGRALEGVQYRHRRLLRLDWGPLERIGSGTTYTVPDALFAARMCVVSSVVATGGAGGCVSGWAPVWGRTFSGRVRVMGACKREQKVVYAAFVSTSDLGDTVAAMEGYTHVPGVGKVNGGYMAYADEIVPAIPRAQTYVLAGHSMGGAVAILAGRRLANEGRRVKVYAFGSPNVGDVDAGDAGAGGTFNVYDIVNAHDPVTKRPWGKSRCGQRHTFALDTGNVNVNHSLKVYREGLLGYTVPTHKPRPMRADELVFTWALDLMG